MGSGTTAVACINTKRNFIGIELSPEYCEIANKRIKELKEKPHV
jgi:site-specific DNA-methyltransferase (adenine-specific)